MNEKEVMETLKKVFKLVVNKNADVENITRDSKIVEDLGITSIGIVYLAIAIEEAFDVDMSDVTYKSFATVGDVIDYIIG